MYITVIKYLLLVLLVSSISTISTIASDHVAIDSVLVKKSQRKMFLIQDNQIVKQYRISIGSNPKGPKEREGDGRTPEGRYILDFKKEDSSFYKAIHISYPNETDIEKAKKNNVDPGGQIMIHGQQNGYGSLAWFTQRSNWTAGCIAVTDEEMDEIWSLVKVNTPIIIKK